MTRRTRTASLTALSLGFALATHALPASSQVTAFCELNPVENRTYNEQPLEGTLKSTEEQLSPDLPFLQYLPNDYDPAQKWPVIVFLHGIGEVGGTLRADTPHSLPRMVEAPEWDWPFIVLSPVLPTPSWHPRWELVRDIFDHAVNNLGGDPNRLYLTGISHGGAGTMAIGIELADRLAAIMPVTPGGDADNFNWDRRASLADTPTLFIIGTDDGEYANTLAWAADMEASGAPMFAQYLLPQNEEHADTIPMTALQETNVFVSYENLPHDIWHAAYGTYCDVVTHYKTVQYNWLLGHSLDGSAFVDPRDGAAVPVPGTAGMSAGGAAGSAGMGAGGDGVVAAGGMAGMGAEPAQAGAAGASNATPGGAGGTTTAAAGSSSAGTSPVAPVTPPATSQASGCVVASESSGRSASATSTAVLLLLGLGALGRRRRRG